MQSWWREKYGEDGGLKSAVIEANTKRLSQLTFYSSTPSNASEEAYFNVYKMLIPENPFAEEQNHSAGVATRNRKSLIDHGLCGNCNEPLQGQRIVKARDTKYHYKCFRCYDCGTNCVKKYFVQNIVKEPKREDFLKSLSFKDRQKEDVHADCDGHSDDVSDQISITAPLRVVDSSKMSTHGSEKSSITPPSSPNSSTFDTHNFSESSSQTNYSDEELTSPSSTIEVVLCEYDTFRRKNLLCSHCDSAIRDKLFIEVNGKKYHNEHVKCCVCHQKTITNEKQNLVYEYNGAFYCDAHFNV